MNNAFSLLCQAQALHNECLHAPGQRRPASAARTMTVALSGEVGTPTGLIAKLVGDRLGWPVYDHELVERVAAELHLPVDQLDRLDEKPQSWLVECLAAFSSQRVVSESAYVRHLVEQMQALARQGSCILVGRGAAQVLPASTTLTVRLVGEWEDRIQAVAQRHRLGRSEALRQAAALSRAQTRFIENHFHVDPTRPENYNLVVNTSRWAYATCADVIVQALERRQAS